MSTPSWFAMPRAGTALRLVITFLLVAVASMVSTRPAGARYDWCSVDPTFFFWSEGRLAPYALDVQVLVPLSALPLAEAATLEVGVPANLTSQEVLNTSTPVLEVQTAFKTLNNRSSSAGDTIHFELVVPGSVTSFPVRLVVTDPQVGTVSVTEGLAGHKVRTTVEASP